VYWGTSTLKISEMTVKLAPLLINEAPHHWDMSGSAFFTWCEWSVSQVQCIHCVGG
jgi:hypothetical protein